MDELDRKILSELQSDASRSLEEIAAAVGSSRSPVWNRIKNMRDSGVIRGQVALLDPDAVGCGTCFFVLVRTSSHEKDWQDRFLQAIRRRPEVLEAHRLAGEIDYLLKVRVPDAKGYDRFYQALIADVSIFNVTALLSMEEIKATTALPI